MARNMCINTQILYVIRSTQYLCKTPNETDKIGCYFSTIFFYLVFLNCVDEQHSLN